MLVHSGSWQFMAVHPSFAASRWMSHGQNQYYVRKDGERLSNWWRCNHFVQIKLRKFRWRKRCREERLNIALSVWICQTQREKKMLIHSIQYNFDLILSRQRDACVRQLLSINKRCIRFEEGINCAQNSWDCDILIPVRSVWVEKHLSQSK